MKQVHFTPDGTEKINVLVLASGETVEIQLFSIDENTNFGCDPMNSADKLMPDARYFLQDMHRSTSKSEVTTQGLPAEAIDWLTRFFHEEN